jgi:hypothetical protein
MLKKVLRVKFLFVSIVYRLVVISSFLLLLPSIAATGTKVDRENRYVNQFYREPDKTAPQSDN